MTAYQTVRVVAAILERAGTVFVARRDKDRSSGGLWEFPGGKVEPGEAPKEALHQELREELAVEASIGDFVDRNWTSVNGEPLKMTCYAATLAGSGPERSTDHDAMRWVRLDQLLSLNWAPADIPIIERLPQSLRATGVTPAYTAGLAMGDLDAPQADHASRANQ
ncbi:DNA mismatch repair protein MutT [Brachybacterium vulturis]|uniref:8-oxo-dGTP diphosphatase n=1 Tax=Brachybacterium vulturis TaxID=2017484 RepID=A0A291GKD6_9MICO|nr:(deoxy)nucleoside triphosphate pyrophosphohydrolase [Brachybacterium vulturis]ATG50434.1 DNA mismatch repair protein MutT [Brachybacterium vulturis]